MFDMRYTAEFDADFERLARFDVSLALELRSLIHDELERWGRVPDGYGPHVLDNAGGLYNGYMEFHLADDVLVLYWPPKPHGFVRMVRICTHEELRTGRFAREWPRS